MFTLTFFLFVALSAFCDGKEPFELAEVLEGDFANLGWNGTWISDNSFLYKKHEKYYKMNVDTFESTGFIDNVILDGYTGATFTLSNDQKFILIRYNSISIFRHSKTAQFVVHDLEKGTYYDIANKTQLQHCSWGNENSLLYVLDNNIYYLGAIQNNINPQQITTDGVPGVIYNGVPDWVYEEEVLSSGSAMWMSPDGKYLAYAHFNDRDVGEFTYYIYGNPGTMESQYPEIVKLRYPKVGATNPSIALKVVNLQTHITTTLNILPGNEPSNNYVLYDVTWATNNEVVALITNRIQNDAFLQRCDVTTDSCTVENEFKQEKGWLNLNTPVYNKEGNKNLHLVSLKGFTHILLTDLKTGDTTQLTDGERVVTDIHGWDEHKNVVYYGGSMERNHSQQHIFSVNTKTLLEECLTCLVGEFNCQYATVSFSKDLSNMVKICTGTGPSKVLIQNLKTNNTLWWQLNTVLVKQLSNKLMPVVKDLTIDLESGFTAKVRLLLPPNLNENDSKKYPMVVNVYAGPDSNQISDSFSIGFQHYIVTNREYIYAYIDGRGSGRRGDDLMFQIYRKLGTVEIEDQITVTRTLQQKYKFIDAKNTGIWGWSYGGFATAWAMVKDRQNVFKFGLSVAPVTSFIYYDTIYTERYMSLPTPEDNEEGYNNTDVTRNIEGFRGKNFFLIHGNADDNVHYQQAMHLTRALELADINFSQMSYPDENHSLRGVSPHLYHTIDRFWAKCFGVEYEPKRKHRSIDMVLI